MQLIAGNSKLDLSNDTQLNIIYSVKDIQDYSTRTTTFSKDFELPSTPNNDEFFETLYQLDKSYSKFNPKVKVQAILTQGGQTIIKGYLQLIDINKNNNGTFYNVQIVGNLINLIDRLKDLSLRDLDLSEYDHIRSITNVKNSWSYNIVKNGTTVNSKEGYVYPYIIYNQEDNVEEHTYLYNMFPAVYIKTLIDKIFEKSNYEYKSQFLTSDYFSKLILPFALDKLPINQQLLESRTAIRGVVNEIDQISVALTPVKSPSTNWWYNRPGTNDYRLKLDGGTAFTDSTTTVNNSGTDLTFKDSDNLILNDRFTAPADGIYSINIDLKCYMRYVMSPVTTSRYDSGALRYRWQIILIRPSGNNVILKRNELATSGNPYHVDEILPSTEYFSDFTSGMSSSSLWKDDVSATAGLSPLYNGNVFLKQGEQIVVMFGMENRIIWNTDGFTNVQIRLARSLGNEVSLFDVKPYNGEIFGNEDIKLSNTLPNISITNFMQSIVQMFNLIIEPDKDNPNLLNIEPYSDYYANGKIKDFTDKIENDDDINIILTPELNEINLTYVEDNDWLNQTYISEQKQIWGEYKFWLGNEFSDETQKLNLIFSPTPTTNIGTRIAPFLVKMDESGIYQKTTTNPRILFYDGLKEGTPYTFAESLPTIDEGTLETLYPYCGMWDDPYKPNNTLEFFPSLKMYYNLLDNINPQLPLYNLFNKFHQFSLKPLVDKDFRQIELTLYLNATDINSLKLNDIIKLHNQLYKILEVEYVTGIEDEFLSRIVLQKIVDFNFYQPVESIGLNVCPFDVKSSYSVQYGNILTSSTGNINEECCSAMGGTLLENGVCQMKLVTIHDTLVDLNVYTPGVAITAMNGPYIINPSVPVNFSPIHTSNTNTLLSVLDTIAKSNNFVDQMQKSIEDGLVPSGTGTQYTLPIWINDEESGDTLGNSIISQINTNTTVQIGGSLKVNTITNDDLLTKIVVIDNDGNINWRDVSTIVAPISGTLNYVAKFTPDGTSIGDSQIFDNGTNVGINTITPTAQLQIVSTSTNAAHSVVSLGTLQVKGNGSVFNNGLSNINTNTVFGQNSLINNTTGFNNTAFGFETLLTNTTGTGNTAIGLNVLKLNTTGSNNTSIGPLSLTNNTTGSTNTAVGQATLRFNTIGGNNSAFSADALTNNTEGNSNTAIGNNALRSNTIGDNNTATGANSLFSNTTGSNNTSIGNDAIRHSITGSNNFAAGVNAGRSVNAGSALATINNSVFIGFDTRALSDNETNTIVIGYNARGNGSNTVTLGNNNITKTYLKGISNLHTVGVTTATTVLATDVDGNIVDGSSLISGGGISNSTTYNLYLGPLVGNATHYLQPSGWSTSSSYTISDNANTSGRFRCYHSGKIDGLTLNWRYTTGLDDRTVTYVMHNLTQATSKTIAVVAVDIPAGIVGVTTRILSFDFNVNVGDTLQIRATTSNNSPVSGHYSSVIFSING
jgi:hypothetical protein